VMTYAGGQVPALDAEPLLYWHADGFARADHRVLDLLRDIALSDAFRTTGSPE
jgi:hypothetical protein